MGTNFFNRLIFFPLSLLLVGCPSEDCTFATKDTRIENLAKIEPVQEVYYIGDTLTYNVAIPSHIENFGNIGEVNLFQETGIRETLYSGSGIHNFLNNEINILKGNTEVINETLVANVIYYPETNDYRFKARIVFTEAGNYTILGLNNTQLRFDSGNNFCTEYVIQTSTQDFNFNGNGTFNFTVQE